MPNWKIHLEVANRLNSKIKYSGLKEEEFMLGNILPDINNGYLVKNIIIKKEHKITHYDGSEISYIKFYNKYKDKFYEPIVFGYFVHLYTDYTWNNDFYTKIDKSDKYKKYSKDDLRIMKQEDYKVYNNKYRFNNLKITNVDNLVIKSNLISNVEIYKSDLLNVLKFLKNTDIYEKNMQFYDEKQLDKLLENTVNDIFDRFCSDIKI